MRRKSYDAACVVVRLPFAELALGAASLEVLEALANLGTLK